MGGSDGTLLRPIKTDAAGELQVDIVSSALPSGAATEATLAAMSAKLPATLGQKAMAASMAVVLASDQSAIPVSQSGTWSTRTQDGSGNAITSTVNALDINLKTSSITLNVSAAQSGTWNINNISGTISLPTGAATEATLSTASTTLTAISGKLPATLGQKAMAASLAVVIASDQSAVPASQSGTWNINNISGTVSLPTGAATEATLAALSAKIANDYGVASGAVRTAAQVGNASGVADFNAGATGAQTLRVSANLMRDGNALSYNTGAADASTIRVALANESKAQTGRSVVTTVRNDYTSTSVTTGAWVQLIASTGSAINLLEIFDSSGQTLELGTGAAASETRLILVTPGGNGQVPVAIAAGTRVSIRAVSATASVGELDINCYS